jgi:hypothetical protein
MSSRIQRQGKRVLRFVCACLLALPCFSHPTLRSAPWPDVSNLAPIVSGTDRVRVIELFTSEGCSSCPPADAWLNRLMNDPELWRSIVPVAFHVDYWDHIGWQDRFADADFSDRQRRYAALHDDRIYTPAFFINGGIWREFFSGRQPRDAPRQYGGVLSARGTNGGSFILSYRNEHFDGEAFSANGVLLGPGISSKVSRGENSGLTRLSRG